MPDLDQLPTFVACKQCLRAMPECACGPLVARPAAAIFIDDLPPEALEAIREDRVELAD